MNRRTAIAAMPALAVGRSLLAAAGASTARIGICTFSCHQHWKAVAANHDGVKFSDAISFYEYGRSLGAEGVQTSLRSTDVTVAQKIRALVEKDGGYYEADIRLPKNDGDLDVFETDVRLAREAGATIARTFFMATRRYEVFSTLDEFERFHAGAQRSLELAEPVVRRHRLKLAIENHKDHTTEELIALLRKMSSEWIGALVDIGNNIALLEEPHGVVEALAPYAMSVHFKDMAVQSDADGFLLSEVPLGTGMLDLPRIIATLRKANCAIVLNLEMATRDPLKIPCLTDGYFATFPQRKATHLETAMQRVKANPPRQPPPSVSGKPVEQVLGEEETNNRHCPWLDTESPSHMNPAAASLPGIKLFNLNGRSALISGGSKGLGYAMAAGLASAGAEVMLVSRHLDEAQAGAATIARDFGRQAIGHAADVTLPDQVDAMIATAERELGKVDILINSAGINIRGPIGELTLEQFEQVMRTNVTGTWLCCRAVLPGMRARQWGRIINVASALALVGLAGRTPYTASKGAVAQTTRTLALETAADGITANALCPGPFLTEMNLPIADTEEGQKFVVGATALKRWGRLDEIQGAALFLASDAGSYVTGAMIPVDGGWTAQ